MLFVFDLDFTLWDCGGTWCDCTTPPYRKDGESVLDSSGRLIYLYPDVPDILEKVKTAGHKLAAASRTHEPDWARELLHLLGISDLFDWKEIYPGPKIPHFKSLQQKSGIPFGQMFFFDDELRNIRDISRLGVHSVLVENGLSQSQVSQFL
ncbi:MAG: magnesium-dependent phosphatase-1 [Spirochaetales bacterium]|nr:magnesium-dependent phosphatase-1 [Spirochaetales bacterium]